MTSYTDDLPSSDKVECAFKCKITRSRVWHKLQTNILHTANLNLRTHTHTHSLNNTFMYCYAHLYCSCNITPNMPVNCHPPNHPQTTSIAVWYSSQGTQPAIAHRLQNRYQEIYAHNKQHQNFKFIATLQSSASYYI